jgi:hypothetical protein
MTFTKPATTNKYPIHATGEGPEYMLGINPSGAHQPYNPDIGRVLITGNSCQIRSTVATPVAKPRF